MRHAAVIDAACESFWLCFKAFGSASKLLVVCDVRGESTEERRGDAEIDADELDEGGGHPVPTQPAAVARVHVDGGAWGDGGDVGDGKGDPFGIGQLGRGAAPLVTAARGKEERARRRGRGGEEGWREGVRVKGCVPSAENICSHLLCSDLLGSHPLGSYPLVTRLGRESGSRMTATGTPSPSYWASNLAKGRTNCSRYSHMPCLHPWS